MTEMLPLRRKPFHMPGARGVSQLKAARMYRPSRLIAHSYKARFHSIVSPELTDVLSANLLQSDRGRDSISRYRMTSSSPRTLLVKVSGNFTRSYQKLADLAWVRALRLLHRLGSP